MIASTEMEKQVTAPSMKYWGGFLDETLNFDIEVYPKPTEVTPDNRVYQPHIFVSSSDKSKLEFVQRHLPEQVVARINPDYTDPEQRGHDRWKLNVGNAVGCFRFLQWIMPHLEYKQAQAVVFSEFLEQKREVIRLVDGLTRVPRLYPTPEDRMEVEEDFREKLIVAKSQTIDITHLPDPERLAGIFDASGSFGVYTTKRFPSGTPEYSANCQLISVQQGLLTGLYKEYRGARPIEYNPGLNRYSGQSFVWQVSGYEVGRLLKDIEPYLVIKQTEARFAIDFLRVKQALFGVDYSNDPTIKAQRSKVLRGYTEDWKTISHNAGATT